MVQEIFKPKNDNAKCIPETIDVVLYVLGVNPSHQCTFANTPAFDRIIFER